LRTKHIAGLACGAGLIVLALSRAVSPGAALAVGGVVTPLPPVTISDPRFGVVEAHAQPGLARDAGARWTRANFWWNQIQPRRPDEWQEMSHLSDADIDATIAASLNVVGLIGNPPNWATRNGSVPLNLKLSPDDPNHYWAQFVGRLVERYKGKIDTWIIWNEPDIDVGLPMSTWGGDMREYVDLMRSAYLAAKKANPASRVILSGNAYWFDQGRDRRIWIERFLREVTKEPDARANNYFFDAANIHLYSTPLTLYEIPQVYRDTLKRYGLEKPIWISETNVIPWDDPVSRLPRGGFRATLQEQGNFIIQAYSLALAAGVERIAVYKLQDGMLFNREPFGLLRNDASPRPAYVAYQVMTTYLANMGQGDYRRQDGIDQVVFQQGKRRVTVFWNSQPGTRLASVVSAGSRAVLVDKTGEKRDLRVPTVPGQNSYSLPVAPATANVADLDPGRFIIGGDPLILVEEGVGEAMRLEGGRLYFPLTGHVIGGAFARFFERWGGLGVFGYPRTAEVPEGGRPVQYFQRARMEFAPEKAGTPDEVQLGLLATDLRGGRPSPAPVDPGAGGRLYAETGYWVGPSFLDFFDALGGVRIFGFPTGNEEIQGNRRTQQFQRVRAELATSPGEPPRFQLALLGDELLKARGLLPQP